MIIRLIHPRQEPIPRPNRLTPRYRICDTQHTRLHRIPRIRPHRIPKQPNGTLQVVVVGEETSEIIHAGNRPNTAGTRSIVTGILSQERGQLIRDELLISTLAQHRPSIRRTLGHLHRF